jgi:VIT family
MSTTDAEAVVAKMASYESFFVNAIVAEEIGSSGEDDDASLLADGLVNVLSFAAFGCVPLIVYFALSAFTYDAPFLYVVSLFSASGCGFVLGGLKSNFSANNNSFMWLGSETLAMLAVGAFLAYYVGKGVSDFLF